MISFEEKKSNSINIIYFNNIINEYLSFEKGIKLLLIREKESIISDYKPFSQKNIKTIEDNVLNSFIKIIQAKTEKYKNIKAVGDLSLDRDSSIKDEEIEDEFKNILLTKSTYCEKISVENAIKIFKYLLNIDQLNLIGNKKNVNSNKLELLLEAIVLNIHTHTSKIVNSSSSFNITSLSEDKSVKGLGLNSKTLKEGLDISYTTGGGVYKYAKELIKALSIKYYVDVKSSGEYEEYCLLKIIMDILFKLKNNIDLNIIEKNIYEELQQILGTNSDLVSAFDHAMKKTKNNLGGLAQLIYGKNNRSESEFKNLIPLASNRVIDATRIIAERVQNLYEQEKNKSLEESGKLSKENEVVYLKKEIRAKSNFYKIKSVASNAQNISDFASSVGANFTRFNSIPYIKQKKEKNERIFFILKYVLLKEVIKNEEFIDYSYSKIITNIDAKLKLPNKILENLSIPYLEMLAKKIIYKINTYKNNISKIEDKSEMERKISKDIVQAVLQKYVLGMELSELDINTMIDFLIKLFEFESYLSQKEKDYVKRKVVVALCI